MAANSAVVSSALEILSLSERPPTLPSRTASASGWKLIYGPTHSWHFFLNRIHTSFPTGTWFVSSYLPRAKEPGVVKYKFHFLWRRIKVLMKCRKRIWVCLLSLVTCFCSFWLGQIWGIRRRPPPRCHQWQGQSPCLLRIKKHQKAASHILKTSNLKSWRSTCPTRWPKVKRRRLIEIWSWKKGWTWTCLSQQLPLTWPCPYEQSGISGREGAGFGMDSWSTPTRSFSLSLTLKHVYKERKWYRKGKTAVSITCPARHSIRRTRASCPTLLLLSTCTGSLQPFSPSFRASDAEGSSSRGRPQRWTCSHRRTCWKGTH